MFQIPRTYLGIGARAPALNGSFQFGHRDFSFSLHSLRNMQMFSYNFSCVYIQNFQSVRVSNETAVCSSPGNPQVKPLQ